MKFENKIKLRFGFAVGYFVIGMGLVLSGVFRILENDTAFSLGIMLVIGGAYRFRQYFRLLRNPERLRGQEIKETDERNVQLAVRAGNLTFRLGVLLIAVSMLVSYFAGQQAAVQTLSSVLCCSLLIYYIAYIVFSKKS